jgi:hypothetical protein
LTLLTAGLCQGATPGKLHLDAVHSTLTATALKNGKKEVPVHFPGLKGWADLTAGTAKLVIPLKTLSTGDVTRDYNVKTLFFEVSKLAAYSKATFKLEKVDADLSHLGAAAPISTLGHGSLTLHGASLALDGPLVFTRKGDAVIVDFKEPWIIAIDKTSLVEALAHMNKNCPQPHHVANDVKITGELVFVP